MTTLREIAPGCWVRPMDVKAMATLSPERWSTMPPCRRRGGAPCV